MSTPSMPSTDLPEDAIAIVGIAGRFPGADDHDALRAALLEGRELLREFTREELLTAGVPAADVDSPDYVPVAGVPTDVAGLDDRLFGIPPAEAALIDPQQRLFLECCWAALEDASCMQDGDPLRTGVFGAADFNTYLPLIQADSTKADAGGAFAFQVELANDKEYVASRVSYRLGLTGPSLAVQTACSSSLVAVHYACQSLLLAECDLALAGGSRIHLPLYEGHLHVVGGASSAEGHCRAFDARASGTVRGSGAAVVALRRAEDAVRDGDRIYALILGSAVNNDGADKVGFTAPSVRGQARAIRDAHRAAGVAAAEVAYVETHGTGTVLGDPIEIEALVTAFGGRAVTGQRCLLGALKPNIGHLGAAAGVAGLIKAAMSLEAGIVPATLHYETPNPELRLDSTPFWLSAEQQDLPPRAVAGVSAFGIGGTNAHVIVQAPGLSPVRHDVLGPQLLPVSVATPTALRRRLDDLGDVVRDAPDASLAGIARSLQHRRSLTHRWVGVADTPEDLASQLGVGGGDSGAARPICFVFPGQGAESAGAGSWLAQRFASFASDLRLAAEITRDEFAVDLGRFLDDGTVPSGVSRTALVQPALFTLGAGVARLLSELGIAPSVTLGHSVGELAAACVAGVMSFEDGVRMSAERGQVMAAMPRGAMTAVRCTPEELDGLLDSAVTISAINAPRSVVIAGDVDGVAAGEERLQAAGLKFRRLPVEHAFHTRHADVAAQEFERRLARLDLAPPARTIVSAATAELVDGHAAMAPATWSSQLRMPVRFAAAAEVVREMGDFHYVECGPGATLSHLLRECAPELDEHSAMTLGVRPTDEGATFYRAVGSCWVRGAKVVWSALPESRAVKTRLPVYPFERRRHWAGSDADDGDARPEPPVARAQADASQNRPPIRDLAAAIIGVASDDLQPDVTFVEHGFESLALLELADAVRRHYGVRLSLVELLDDHTTIARLDAHVVATTASPATTSGPATTPAAEDSVAAQPAPVAGTAIHASPQAAPATPWPALPSAPRDGAADLGDRDVQSYLDRFIPEFIERTRESKALNAVDRGPHADPRSSVGFRQAIKEIVYPIVADRSAGASIWDIDGNRYTDLSMGFGTNLLGHGPELVRNALHAQIDEGYQVGPQSHLAGEVAAAIHRMTGVDRVAFTNSGSEAVMSALRIARCATRRDRVVMFAGSYHGTFDGVLARASAGGSAGAPLAVGTTRGMVQDVVVLEYGTEASMEYVVQHANEIAAVLVEPVQSRRPAFQPVEFLRALRAVTAERDIVLIFDEVITGFRCHPGGAQARFGVTADLVTYGKVLGGGMPIGAVAGRGWLLDYLDGGEWSYGDASRPETDLTFFAGTFCKHPLAMAASRAVLHHLEQEGGGLQQELEARTEAMATEMRTWFQRFEAPLDLQVFSSQFVFSVPDSMTDLWTKALVHRGVYVWEGRTCFLSTAHTAGDVANVADAVADAARDLVGARVLRRRRQEPSRDGYPLRDAQELLVVAAALDGDSHGYNEVLVVDASAASDEQAEAAASALFARHIALRLSFDERALRQRERDPPESLRIEAVSDHEATKRRIAELRVLPATHTRAVLLRVSGDRAFLVLVVPHIFLDEWANTLLRVEAITLLTGGEAIGLEQTAQFDEFLHWEAGEIAARRPALERDWEQHLDGVDPAPFLSGWRSGTRTAESISAELSQETADAARRLCAELGVTPFALGLAAWGATLYQESGRRSIATALHVAGQPAFGDPRVVGYCLTVVPVLFDVDAQATCADFVATVSRAVLFAQQRTALPASWIIERFWSDRLAGTPPFGGTAFQVERMDPTTPSGLVERPNTQWDAAMTLEISDARWQAVLTTPVGFLAASHTTRLLSAFVSALSVIVDTPDALVAERLVKAPPRLGPADASRARR